MRVKMNASETVPALEFGRTYELKLATGSGCYRFTFTRGRHIYYKEINRGAHISGDMKMSKKTLKRLLNTPEFTARVVEADYRPDVIHALFGAVDYPVAFARVYQHHPCSVFMSRLEVEPSDIDIVDMPLGSIIDTLSGVYLTINNIVGVWVKGEIKRCVGVTFLRPYMEINGEYVRSLYICVE